MRPGTKDDAMHRNHRFGQPPWPAERELTLAGEVALPEPAFEVAVEAVHLVACPT